MTTSFEVPEWAGKPPVGLHLDVLKEDRLVQKLMLDQKKCYYFGRNKEFCDFSLDHQSCSRVHAVFVYHKFLEKSFLVDLGSTHGTFIGNLRIEADKPTFIPIDSYFHFGHSTRIFKLRGRPKESDPYILEEYDKENDKISSEKESAAESALENLTEYNTAQNRKIQVLGIDDIPRMNTYRRKNVTFNDDDIIINPEDVDPSIGRFRNLIQTTIIPTKRSQDDHSCDPKKLKFFPQESVKLVTQRNPYADLYYNVPGAHGDGNESGPGEDSSYTAVVANHLGLSLPNPAPDVEPEMKKNAHGVEDTNRLVSAAVKSSLLAEQLEPRKKKYAKEAWPGRKH